MIIMMTVKKIIILTLKLLVTFYNLFMIIKKKFGRSQNAGSAAVIFSVINMSGGPIFNTRE